jgi:hypothetical protein
VIKNHHFLVLTCDGPNHPSWRKPDSFCGDSFEDCASQSLVLGWTIDGPTTLCAECNGKSQIKNVQPLTRKEH